MSFTCNYKCATSGLEIDNAYVSIEAIVYRPGQGAQVIYQVYVSEEAWMEHKAPVLRQPIDISYADLDVGIVSQLQGFCEGKLSEKISPQVQDE